MEWVVTVDCNSESREVETDGRKVNQSLDHLYLFYLTANRVLKCDVIKMKFLKLWDDLSGYSERTMSKRPTCQK